MKKTDVHIIRIGSSNPSRVEGKSGGGRETYRYICAWGVYRRQRMARVHAKEAIPAKKMAS
jgi:hypothetical protein